MPLDKRRVAVDDDARLHRWRAEEEVKYSLKEASRFLLNELNDANDAPPAGDELKQNALNRLRSQLDTHRRISLLDDGRLDCRRLHKFTKPCAAPWTTNLLNFERICSIFLQVSIRKNRPAISALELLHVFLLEVSGVPPLVDLCHVRIVDKSGTRRALPTRLSYTDLEREMVDEDEITPVMSFLVSPDLARNEWVLIHACRFTVSLQGGRTVSVDVPAGTRAPGDAEVLLLRANLILNHLVDRMGYKPESAKKLARAAYFDDLRRNNSRGLYSSLLSVKDPPPATEGHDGAGGSSITHRGLPPAKGA